MFRIKTIMKSSIISRLFLHGKHFPINNIRFWNRKIFRFLIFVALIIVSASFYNKCEEFDYEIVQWMPYDERDKILLSDSLSVDTLTVNSREIKHDDGYPFLSCCACENSYSMSLSSGKFEIFVHFADSKSYANSSIVINGEHLQFSQYFDSYEINGKKYTDVLEYINYWNDQSKNYSKIIIAKSIGMLTIIGPDKEWIITDDSKRTIDPEKIPVITDNC